MVRLADNPAIDLPFLYSSEIYLLRCKWQVSTYVGTCQINDQLLKIFQKC